MNVIRWPEPISEHGRLSEGPDAYRLGMGPLFDPLGKCPKTLLVKLSSATSVAIVRLPGNIA